MDCTATTPSGSSFLFSERIEARRVELAHGVAVRVGEVDDDDVEEIGLLLDPDHRVLVHDAHLRRFRASRRSGRGRAGCVVARRVISGSRSTSVTVSTSGCFRISADGEAVAAPEDGDAPARGRPPRRRDGRAPRDTGTRPRTRTAGARSGRAGSPRGSASRRCAGTASSGPRRPRPRTGSPRRRP